MASKHQLGSKKSSPPTVTGARTPSGACATFTKARTAIVTTARTSISNGVKSERQSTGKLEGIMKKLDWLLIAVAVVVFATMVALKPKKAHAHDPNTHQADDLSKATSEAFGSCCVGDDYSKLVVGEWETTETGYRVFYKGRWLEGSRRTKVSNMENPDGEAKAWIFGEGDTAYIRCFMAGARS